MSILWQPSPERITQSKSHAFIKLVNQTQDIQLKNFHDLYTWSIENPEEFWSLFWDFSRIIAKTKSKRILINGDDMLASQWFPDATLNFAENLLSRRDEHLALVFWAEKKQKRTLSYRELYQQVASVAAWLRAEGIDAGDRVAAVLPNIPETIVAMLATTSLGAVWSSCSPDFGVDGVLDRFAQIEPKVLLCSDGYFYNGKTYHTIDKAIAIQTQLPSVKKMVLVSFVNPEPDTVPNNTQLWGNILSTYPNESIDFVPMAFNDPLYILFSSGTTGIPKCIVHGIGGTLIQHKKEHLLHCDITPNDKVFYFTTCGWMMWNWLTSALASQATVMLYDGAPMIRGKHDILFEYIEQEKITIFGTSAKYIDAIRKRKLNPKQTHNLSSLHTLLSTGSVLSVDGFDYVYKNIKTDLCLSSISGGTDILSCFALGSVTLPVHRGELQTRGLGMSVEVWDKNKKPVVETQGELVCTKTFPAMPIGFWNDATRSKYRTSYFETHPNVWHHGDYVMLTQDGGMVFYGRSDTTLNPGGVRIGTAEIYRQVEKTDAVLESIVIGQNWQNDIRVVLFVVLNEGIILDDNLQNIIKQKIRENTTPRHVPAKIIQVTDIPRTKSGKIVEIAVRDTIHGKAIKNQSSLANPEVLEQYKDLPELQK